MTANTAAAKARTGKANQRPASDRLIAEGTEAVRDFAQLGAANTKDTFEKTKVAVAEVSKVAEQTYSTIAKSAAEFNLQWIEMVRANTTSTLDFARQLVGVKSPSEFLELSAAQARWQFESLTEQAQQLAALAQKVTSDAVQPLHQSVKNSFRNAA